MRLSVRTLAELVALAAIAVGLWDLHRSSQPPGPALRALAMGDEADRVAALRGLALLGDDGVPIVPELVLACREDPSPAVRRGALYALSQIALVEPPAAPPVEAALSGPDTNADLPVIGGRSFRRELPMLRPRADEVAAALVDRMRADPNPSVRVFALGCLRKLLNAADTERSLARASLKPNAPPPEHEASGPWVESAALAIARAARDPDPEVAGHAIGVLNASVGRMVLDDARRGGLLVDLVLDDPADLPTDLDLMALNSLAGVLGPSHVETPRLLDLLLGRLADPPVSGAPGVPREELARDARLLYGSILWSLVPSAGFLDEHPDAAEALIALLSGEQDRQFGGAEHRHEYRTARFTADHLVVDPLRGGRSWGGGRWPIQGPRAAALEAISRDPRMLDLLWPRLALDDRHQWLANSDGNGHGRRFMPWSAVDPLLDSPDIRSDLPPDEATALLSRLLDEPGPEMTGNALNRLENEVEHRRQGRPDADFDASREEVARLILETRALAVLCDFARAAEADSEAVSRLVGRLVPLLDAVDPPARSRAAALLGSLGPAASPSLPALEALAAEDPDEDVRLAAEAALGRIRGTGSREASSMPPIGPDPEPDGSSPR